MRASGRWMRVAYGTEADARARGAMQWKETLRRRIAQGVFGTAPRAASRAASAGAVPNGHLQTGSSREAHTKLFWKMN